MDERGAAEPATPPRRGRKPLFTTLCALLAATGATLAGPVAAPGPAARLDTVAAWAAAGDLDGGGADSGGAGARPGSGTPRQVGGGEGAGSGRGAGAGSDQAVDPPGGTAGGLEAPAGTSPSVPVAPPAPPGAGVPAPGARYAWPLLPAPAVVTPFRGPSNPFGPGHRGVDLAGAAGQPVLAARAGVVVFAGPVAGRGSVSVQHDDGLRTTYEPVTPAASAGAVVTAGQVIGLLEPGHPGCPGPCLHWGARRDRLVYVDPLVLLAPPRVRLLPVPQQWPPRPE